MIDLMRTMRAPRSYIMRKVTIPSIVPWLIASFRIGIGLSLVGAVVGYATCLDEFGAVITFAANIPGQTQTLPLAIYAVLQEPGGEAEAWRLAAISFAIAFAGLIAAEFLQRRARSWRAG